jgi:hypothetical protein
LLPNIYFGSQDPAPDIGTATLSTGFCLRVGHIYGGYRGW